MLYKEETFVGTVLIMPIDNDDKTKRPLDTEKSSLENEPARWRPIKFRIDAVIERYNSSRQKKDHLTLYKIEQLTGVSSTTTWRHRTGRHQGIDWDTLAKYCEVLECTPGDLLYYERGSIDLKIKKSK
jgi:putative transcriptional regulator